MLTADEGYFFGIGAFETVAVEEGRPMLLRRHYERLQRAAEFLGFGISMEEIGGKVEQSLVQPDMKKGRKVLKITVSPQNVLVTTRENTYRVDDYKRGFTADLSRVRRNETSPFTYHKTLNYGDCLLEKRQAKARGVDEPIFLNGRGELAEGATTNLFLVRDGKVFTPSVASGLLPGIIRAYICEICQVEERVIQPQEIMECQEMFLTNSLLGVMPVTSFGAYRFPEQKTARELLARCRIASGYLEKA